MAGQMTGIPRNCRSIWMKVILICLATLVSSCEFKLVESNSTSGDRETYDEVPIDDSTPEKLRFSLAMGVIRKNCASCHTYTAHKLWNAYGSDEDWIKNGYVTRGDLSNSRIYFRMRVSDDVAGGPKTMPPEGALEPGDVAVIREWIDKM